MQSLLLLLLASTTLAFRTHTLHQHIPARPSLPNTTAPRPRISLFAMSERESQFRGLMDDLTKYSPSEISTIRSARNRAIFSGAKAAANNPRVVDAFIVLYEDLSPLRIAGNMIFNYLTARITKSIEQFDSENSVQIIRDSSDETDDTLRGTIRLGKAAFEAIDKDRSGSITRDELSDEILKVFGFDSVNSFMSTVDTDNNNELNFEEFMIALIKTTEGAHESINEIIAMNNDGAFVMTDDESSVVVVEKSSKYSIRYDNMLKSVSQWEGDIIGVGGVETVTLEDVTKLGRTERILYGCFSGAKDPQVVEALRSVYVDFTALRMAGDIIFKLLTKYMNSKTKKAKANTKQ